MLQFHKAAFSLETAVNNFRTGVGRRFLQWEEGADLGLRSCWLHSTLPCLHWATWSQSQFEPCFPTSEAQRMIRFCWFFTALCSSGHKLPLDCRHSHLDSHFLAVITPKLLKCQQSHPEQMYAQGGCVLLAPRPGCITCRNLTPNSSDGEMHR